MSELGVHVASGNRTGLGEILDAGPAVVVAIDQDVRAEVRQRAPGAKLAFRTQQPDGNDNPPGLLETPLADIPLVAARWCESRWPIWQSNAGADWYIVNNELDVSTLESAQKLNAFFLACMAWCEGVGLRAGICSFSTGCPSDDGGLTLEQRWQPLLPAVAYAALHGHVIVLHAHAMDHGPLSRTGENIAYRHERSLRYFAQHGIKPLVIIGEVSNGVGGVEPNVSDYMVEIGAWDVHVMDSVWRDQVIGGALYGFNAAETLRPAASQIASWIATHPTPITPIEPPPDPIRMYHRVYHLLPKSAPYARRIEVDFEADPRGETVGRSIDDAFVTSPHLLSRKVYVWDMTAFAEFNFSATVLEAWVAAHYPGPIEIIYREFAA